MQFCKENNEGLAIVRQLYCTYMAFLMLLPKPAPAPLLMIALASRTPQKLAQATATPHLGAKGVKEPPHFLLAMEELALKVEPCGQAGQGLQSQPGHVLPIGSHLPEGLTQHLHPPQGCQDARWGVGQSDGPKDRQAGQTGRQADGEMNRQADRQTGRHIGQTE